MLWEGSGPTGCHCAMALPFFAHQPKTSSKRSVGHFQRTTQNGGASSGRQVRSVASLRLLAAPKASGLPQYYTASGRDRTRGWLAAGEKRRKVTP